MLEITVNMMKAQWCTTGNNRKGNVVNVCRALASHEYILATLTKTASAETQAKKNNLQYFALLSSTLVLPDVLL